MMTLNRMMQMSCSYVDDKIGEMVLCLIIDYFFEKNIAKIFSISIFAIVLIIFFYILLSRSSPIEKTAIIIIAHYNKKSPQIGLL